MGARPGILAARVAWSCARPGSSVRRRMCGIAGRAGPRGKLDGARVLAALAHRGPDASGTDQFDLGEWSCSTVHTRLAINDLSPAGNQPLHNEDGSVTLVFNGEIYNSPELRRRCEAAGHRFRSRSDGEVIVHLWEDEGTAAFRRLNGIFALALLDRRRGELVLARDPLGVKPLFWSAAGTSLWFASELRALRAVGAPLAGPDPVALAQFLTFLWVPDPRTPFAGAHSLAPGQLLVWRAGEHRRETYCDLVEESASAPPVARRAARAEVAGRVRQAVRRQLLSDVPVALMASGGIDSSLLWWAADDALSQAYTIGWPRDGDGERLHEDMAAVQRLEGRFSTPVRYLAGEEVDVDGLPASGDLFADPAFALSRHVARTARHDGCKVLLSGHGGDELFGGYRRHVLGPLAARLSLESAGPLLAAALARARPGAVWAEYGARFARAASRPDPLSSYLELCSYSTAADRAAALGCTEREVSDDAVWESHRSAFERTPVSWSLLRRFRAVDVAVYLPGLGLAYVDRAGMEHGVEIRVPWLDLDLVRWALRLPDEALVRRGRAKWLTRSLAADVLPREVVERPKRGFAAPARLLRSVNGAKRGRGFRQARYFATAEAVLATWLQANGLVT